MAQKRTAVFVSDSTGITAEMLGHSILNQFDDINFNKITLPFIDNPDTARETIKRINDLGVSDGARPIIFSTLVDKNIAAILLQADALYLDCFQIFVEPIERELGIRSSPEVGRSHAQQNRGYNSRIDAVNYSLLCDDGQGGKNLRESDVILVGVSRCGKTPTCLFLAMQYGIKAANYPLIPEDLERMRLPESLENFHKKLFGLTIMPNRLSSIRQERRPNSVYASLENCQNEVRKAEALVSQLGIPFLDTTTRSIEEVAAFILQKSKLKRRTF